MELIILIGLQASGKSTFYQRRFAETHELISKDQMLNNKQRARHQSQLITEALVSGRSVVVDNTNASREERVELIALGRQYGATITGYYFEVQVKQSLERNSQRTGKARVPNIAIFATLKRLARPTYSEGFDQLFSVRSAENGGFEVSEWREKED